MATSLHIGLHGGDVHAVRAAVSQIRAAEDACRGTPSCRKPPPPGALFPNREGLFAQCLCRETQRDSKGVGGLCRWSFGDPGLTAPSAIDVAAAWSLPHPSIGPNLGIGPPVETILSTPVILAISLSCQECCCHGLLGALPGQCQASLEHRCEALAHRFPLARLAPSSHGHHPQRHRRA